MKRTLIQLEDEQSRALRLKSLESSKSIAQLIREAVTVYLAQSEAAHAPLTEIAGKFKPLPARKLKDHDQGWTDSIR